jgi:hypothetical protein
MEYRVRFQYRPEDRERLLDYEQSFDLTGSPDKFLLLPDIGDHVDLPSEDRIRGVVENRLFTYMRLGERVTCLSNVVVTDSKLDIGTLMKA